MRSVRISASGGDDDRRRAFPPPRRWCGAVLPPWCGVYHLAYHMVVWCNDGLPPPPGWHIWDAVWWSPHVADTQVGEIRGYARLQPLAGWRKCSPFVIICRRRSGSDGIPSLVQRIYLIYKKCPAPRWGRAPGYILFEAFTSLLLIGFLFRFL